MTQRKRKLMKTLPFFSLLFITYAIIEVGEADEISCPVYCFCYVDPKIYLRVVSCVAQRLDNINLSIPKRVQILDLSNNSISGLEDGAFQSYGLIELVNLVIKHNLVYTIGLHSFVGLPYLQRLDLSDNSLYQMLPWTFYDNSNLRFLSLSENPLGHITHSGPFLNVPSLEVLLLSKCNFAHFPEDAFSALPNLKILDLSHNQLINFEIYPLQILHHLQELDISRYMHEHIVHEIFPFQLLPSKFRCSVFTQFNPWQCNTNLENLNNFLESRSSKLIGSSCDLQTELTTQKSTFEKIISVGIAYPVYDDLSISDESDEDIAVITEKQKDSDCSLQRKTCYEYIFLPPTILSLISFQLGVCTTIFIGYFYLHCKRHKQPYQLLNPVLTMPTQTETASNIVIQEEEEDQHGQVLSATLVCPETPPPSYRDLFMTHYP